MQIEVRCPECDRTVRKGDRAAAEELVASHNESRHDGVDVAKIVGTYDPLDGFAAVLSDPHKKARLHHARRNADTYRAVCLDCEALAVADGVADAREVAGEHDNAVHDGASVAGVLAADLEQEEDERNQIDGPDAIDVLADISADGEVVTDTTE